jgi:hypothetical protein
MPYEILKGEGRLEIFAVADGRFARYGRILEGIDFTGALSCLESSTPIPESGVYVASFPGLEALSLRGTVSEEVFGAMEVQLGYCNGRTRGLDALEYHKSPEVIVADADIVLLLASFHSLEDGCLEARSIEAFLLPAGTAVELYAGTLHFAPCATSPRGYRSLVVLPAGTNLSLPPAEVAPAGDASNPAPAPAAGKARNTGESRLLFARNKWLLARPDCARLMARGAFPGLLGARLECAEAAR